MPELAFYDVDCSEPGLKGWVLVPLRRLVRRLLRPFFYRQAEINNDLDTRLGELLRRQQRLEAFDCDAHALARRLAVIEDYLRTLQSTNTVPEVQMAPLAANLPRLEAFPLLPLHRRETASE
jgi:hypothetical protein